MAVSRKRHQPGTNPYGATKYWNYRMAWSRLAEATERGFHLEAVTIVESILSDRMLSFLRVASEDGRADPRWPFREVISRVMKQADGDDQALLKEIDSWRERRNHLVHAIVKSTPDAPPMEILDFVALAEETAWEGAKLARQFSRWQRQQVAAPKRAGAR